MHNRSIQNSQIKSNLISMIMVWAQWWAEKYHTKLIWMDFSGEKVKDEIENKNRSQTEITNLGLERLQSNKFLININDPELEDAFKAPLIIITGSVVVACAKRINPGRNYTTEGRTYKYWAIPIVQIVNDLNSPELIHRLTATDIAFLKALEINHDTVNFKAITVQEEVASEWGAFSAHEIGVILHYKEYDRSRLSIEVLLNRLQNCFYSKSEGYINAVINFLEVNDLVELGTIPSLIETVYFVLSNKFNERLSKNKFFKELLYSGLQFYLNQYPSQAELLLGDELEESLNAHHVSPGTLEKYCKYELIFIEYFAFHLLAQQKNSTSIICGANYLGKLIPSAVQGQVVSSIYQAQLNFGFLTTASRPHLDGTQLDLIFKNNQIQYYLAARYIVSCLQQINSSLKHLKNTTYTHEWSESVSIEDYIKINAKDESHRPVWYYVKDMLEENNDYDVSKLFYSLLGEYYIKQEAIRAFTKEMVSLPSDFIFDLQRINENEIKITCSKYSKPIKAAIVTGSLHSMLTRFISDNGFEKALILKEPDNDDFELIISSDDAKLVNVIAAILKTVSGPKLTHVPSTHFFFSGKRMQDSNVNKNENLPDSEIDDSISCRVQ